MNTSSEVKSNEKSKFEKFNGKTIPNRALLTITGGSGGSRGSRGSKGGN